MDSMLKLLREFIFQTGFAVLKFSLIKIRTKMPIRAIVDYRLGWEVLTRAS